MHVNWCCLVLFKDATEANDIVTLEEDEDSVLQNADREKVDKNVEVDEPAMPVQAQVQGNLIKLKF